MIKVYCSVPTTGTVADAQVWFWKRTEAKYGDRIQFIWPEQCVRRHFHDFARNEHVRLFLESDADILFFLDSDVVPPDNLMDMVLKHEEWKVAGAPYPIFMTPPGQERPQIMLTAYNGKNGRGLGAADVPESGTAFIDGLATGCMFIKREVLEAMPQPWFEHKYDPTTRMLTEGEDLGFCKKVNAMGHKFYVDYGMVCKHYKTVCLLELNNYAMEYAKRSVEQYDSLIRPKINELVARLKSKKS